MDSEPTSPPNDEPSAFPGMSSSFTRQRTGFDNRSVSSQKDKSTHYATDGTQSSNGKSNQDRPIKRRKDCEAECRKVLKDLGDMKALYNNILLDMNKVNDIEQLLGPNLTFATLKVSYRALLTTIGIATVGLINTGTMLLLSDKGVFTECFLERLKSFTDDFGNRHKVHDVTSAETNQHSLPGMARLENIIQDAVYQSRRRKEVYSDAEIICEALGKDPRYIRPPRLGSDAEAAYLRAAADLEQMCNKLLVDGSSLQGILSGADILNVSIRQGYPAPQLAYRVGDPWSALSLWNSSTSQQALDASHRSLLHHAVDSDDVNLVQHIARTNAQVIRNTGIDIFGMSPLALAAMRNNIKMFDILSEYGAVCFGPDTDTAVLVIAAHLGNTYVVQSMLSRRPGPQLLGKALNRAIERRHEDSVRLILERMRNPACYDEGELESAALNAEWQGLFSLAADIRDVKPFFGTRSQALSDIERANFRDLGISQDSFGLQTKIPAGWWQSETAADVGHVLSPFQSISNPGVQFVALPSQLDLQFISPDAHYGGTFYRQQGRYPAL